MASSSTPGRRWGRSSRSISRPSSSSARSGPRSADRSRSRSPRPRTTTWAASRWTTTAAPRCPASGPAARSPRPASTAPTGWPATRCWRRWCSAPGWRTTCAPAPPASGKTPRGRLAGGASSGLAVPGDAELTAAVRRLMWEKAGLVRDEAGLMAAVAELRRPRRGPSPGLWRGAEPPRGRPAGRRGGAGTAGEPGRPLPFGLIRRADPAWQRRLFLTATPDGSACFEAAEAPLFALAGSRSS